MEARLSTKGQIVIPETIRRKLGLRSGDVLSIGLAGSTISLQRKDDDRRTPAIVLDKLTGYPVLDVGDDAPVLTSEQVRAILDDIE